MPEHRVKLAEVNGAAREVLKKLNVFAQMAQSRESPCPRRRASTPGAGAEIRRAAAQSMQLPVRGGGLNRRRDAADQAKGSREPRLIVQGGEYG
jgi:hypothetical protein